MTNSGTRAQTLIANFHQTLLAKRTELTGSLDQTKFDTLASMGRVAEDDQAQISHEEFITLERNSIDYETLRLVQKAIERAETGEYGVCLACEEPISEKRLRAIPWAEYCVSCQEKRQRRRAFDQGQWDEVSLEAW